MTGPAFIDPQRRPDDAAILAALGRAGGAFTALFERLRAEHPDVGREWRYYADGKSWLLKATRGTATVFWLSVETGAFRVAFYFAERMRDALLAGELSEAMKAEVRATPPIGKLRRVSVRFGAREGIRDVLALVALKLGATASRGSPPPERPGRRPRGGGTSSRSGGPDAATRAPGEGPRRPRRSPRGRG
jgi:hypothetical protein